MKNEGKRSIFRMWKWGIGNAGAVVLMQTLGSEKGTGSEKMDEVKL